MKTLNFTSLVLALMLAFNMTSCLKIESRDAGERANEKLEGNWKLEEFKLNGNAITPGEGEITISFLPSADVSKTGKMITSQPGMSDNVQNYIIDMDGRTIDVDGALSEFTVTSTTLKLWQTSTELGEPIDLEMTLSKK